MAVPLVLLIEDNLNFIRAADAFFNRVNVAHPFARDYKTAQTLLKPNDFQEYDGVITDCFFPYETGSEDRTLGMQAIEKMLATDERGQYIERFTEKIGKYVDLAYPGLLNIVRNYACNDIDSKINNLNPTGEIFKALEAVNTQLGRDEATNRLYNLWTVTFPYYSEENPRIRDYFGALRETMQHDPRNQALGILIAEECIARKLPFVLTTSKHQDDVLTKPIADYCKRNGWILRDCPPRLKGEKTCTAFWEGAYDALLGEMRK